MKFLTFLVSFCIPKTYFGGLDPSSIRSFCGGEINALFGVREFSSEDPAISHGFNMFQCIFAEVELHEATHLS